jgi:hypothetical protein
MTQNSDSTNFNFLEFADFSQFCTGFSDNLVDSPNFGPLAHLIDCPQTHISHWAHRSRDTLFLSIVTNELSELGNLR